MHRRQSGGVNKCGLHNIYSLFSLSAASQEVFFVCLRDFTDMTSAEPGDEKVFRLLAGVQVWSETFETLWLIFFRKFQKTKQNKKPITLLVRLLMSTKLFFFFLPWTHKKDSSIRK